MSAKWTDEQLAAVVWDELDGYGIMGQAIACEAYVAARLILEARAERDTLRTYIDKQMDAYAGQTERMAQLRRDRDAALARVKERDARDACRLERIAALEAENAELRQRTAELEAERSRWTYASPGHLKALSYECAKLGVAARLAGFTPPDQHVRIAENERLRAAFEKVDAITCECAPSTGCPESCERCSWADYSGSIRDQLRAAMEGKGDE